MTEKELNKKAKSVWRGIIYRCGKEKSPYENCEVCKEWEIFENFKKWYIEHYYEVKGCDMEVDKDILVFGNRIYSPETCLIVPQRINELFRAFNNQYNLPTGISLLKKELKKGRYKVSYNGNFIGYFKTIRDACMAHEYVKKGAINEVAKTYKNELPDYVFEALVNWQPEFIFDDYTNFDIGDGTFEIHTDDMGLTMPHMSKQINTLCRIMNVDILDIGKCIECEPTKFLYKVDNEIFNINELKRIAEYLGGKFTAE